MTAKGAVILDRPLSLIARSGGKLFVAPQRAIRARAIRRHLWLPSGRTRRTRLHVNVGNSLGEPGETCLSKIETLFSSSFAESQSLVRPLAILGTSRAIELLDNRNSRADSPPLRTRWMCVTINTQRDDALCTLPCWSA